MTAQDASQDPTHDLPPRDEPLRCPKCSAEMERVAFQSIEVDRCTNCHGLWFDLLEKEELKTFKDAEAIDIGDPSVGRRYNEVDKVECPVCHTPMLRMVDIEQPHIWYESCPVCYGSFFDAGEFRDYKQTSLGDFFRGLFSRERR